MKLSIKPLIEELKTVYENHVTYHEGDAGIDLFLPYDVEVPANAKGFLVPTGVACQATMGRPSCSFFPGSDRKRTPTPMCRPVEMPTGYLLVPRSSIIKTTLRMANSIGVIDAAYRGEVKIPVDNYSDEVCVLKKGRRIAQLFAPTMEPITIEVVDELTDTSRGEGGFGSTGE